MPPTTTRPTTTDADPRPPADDDDAAADHDRGDARRRSSAPSTTTTGRPVDHRRRLVERPSASAAPTATRLTATPVTSSDAATIAGEGQLLAALRRHHRPPLRLGALDVGLLVGDRRSPTMGLQPVVGDEPRRARVAAQARRDRPALEPPAQRAEHLGQPIGQLDPRPRPASARTHSPAIQPSGATLNTPSSRARRRAPRRWRGRRGGGTAPAGRPRRSAGPSRRRAQRRATTCRRRPSRRPGAARWRCVRARPGASRRRTAPPWPAAGRTTNSTSGRSTASSVSGTGCWRTRRRRAPTTRTRCVDAGTSRHRRASRRRRR